MVEVTIRARCLPTESRDKVARAITNLFPDAVVEGDDPIMARSRSLEEFRKQLERQRIRGAARAVLRRGLKGDTMSFKLDKQVASIGRVSFSEEARALGNVEVSISDADIRAVMDSLAPMIARERRT